MEAQIKRWLRRLTPLELAAKELGEIERTKLSVTAEILWAQKRFDYYCERSTYLKNYIKKETS